MTVFGASAASSYAIGQQAQSITQPKRGRHPSVSDVDMQGADAANTSSPASPSRNAGRKVDITA